MILQDNFCLD
uniref:Uncharacterized protein n=1 Tax=Arundo donax TaxID=35708 RepID=A0A0A8Z414_ARUDO